MSDWNYDETPWTPYPSFVSRVQRQISQVPSAPDVDLALRRIGAGIRLLTNEDQDRAHFGDGDHSAVSLVVRRLELLEKVQAAGDNHLRGRWQSLYAYLALTCFDKLGQPSTWVDFATWLTQGQGYVRFERERAVSDVGEVFPAEAAKQLFAAYNRIYSVRTAFRSFVRDVLNSDDRRMLLDSVRAGFDDRPSVPNGRSDQKRLEYLQSVRNGYTHALVFTMDDPTREQIRRLDPNGEWDGFVMQQQYMEGERVVTPMVCNWPMVLSMTVQRGLARWLESRS